MNEVTWNSTDNLDDENGTTQQVFILKFSKKKFNKIHQRLKSECHRQVDLHINTTEGLCCVVCYLRCCDLSHMHATLQ